MAGLVRGIWREPLLRFGLLGLLVFVAHGFLNSPAEPARDAIEISNSQIDAWRGQFRQGNGRWPNAQEQERQIDQWIDEEVLYREALRLGLHSGDAIVRRRLVQRMDFLVEGATPLAPPAEAELQAWLEQNPEPYMQPARLSLEQVFVSRGQHGADLAKVADSYLQRLRAAPQDFVGLGDSFVAPQRLENWSETRLRRDFGKQFLDQLASLPDGQWSGPVASGYGLHLVRVQSRQPAHPARLAAVREQVELDYRLHRKARARRAALDELRLSYRVETQLSSDADG